jgi:hypothetical protein
MEGCVVPSRKKSNTLSRIDAMAGAGVFHQNLLAEALQKMKNPRLGGDRGRGRFGNNFMNEGSCAAASENSNSTLSRFPKIKTQRRNSPLDAGDSGNLAEVSCQLNSTNRRQHAIPSFAEW